MKPSLHRLRGEALLAGAGMGSEAEAAMQQAIDIARRQNAKSWELRGSMSLKIKLDKHNVGYLPIMGDTLRTSVVAHVTKPNTSARSQRFAGATVGRSSGHRRCKASLEPQT